jgi:hypothetical protein
VLLVPLRSGPSLSHYHNRLTILPSLMDRTTCRCPYILPRAACSAWFVPDLGARSKRSLKFACTYRSFWIHIKGKKGNNNDTYIYVNITRFQIWARSHIKCECSDQLAPHTSFQNSGLLLNFQCALLQFNFPHIFTFCE